MCVFDVSLCLCVLKVSGEWSPVGGFSRENIRKETVEQASAHYSCSDGNKKRRTHLSPGRHGENEQNVALVDFLRTRYLFRVLLEDPDGGDHGGAQLLLPAGAWERHDPEGAAERREAEETRGEKNTVSVFNVIFVTFVFITFISHLVLFLRHRKLKNELLEIKRKGSRRPQNPGERQCARCLKTLGLIFDRGDLCEECRLRVCSECRATAAGSRQWRCNVCSKISWVCYLQGGRAVDGGRRMDSTRDL